MKLDKRLSQLETEAPSEYLFNCLSEQDLIQFEELISKKDHTEKEFQKLIELDNKAKRDARLEFLDQYDKPQPFDLRTVFNDFKDYQLKYGRTSSMGNAITPAYPEFQQFLTDNGYQLK